jgi:hypothetical protein
MATASILFPVSGPATFTCGMDVDKDHRLLFDASSDENAVWQFRMPANYSSALTLKLQFACASTQSGTNTVKWNGYLMAVTPDTDAQDLDADSFAAANAGTETLDNDQTAGYARELSITMTNADSVAGGDYCRLKVERDTTDTATGDIELRNAVLEYTTT